MSNEVTPTGPYSEQQQPKKKSAVRTGFEWLLKAAVLRGLGKLFDLIF